MPVFIYLVLAAVCLGCLLLLRLAGGSMPWGQLMIAVGPDGRPMRPRVKWGLWSISNGEPPQLAAVAGLAALVLGGASLLSVAPRLVAAILFPTRPGFTALLSLILSVACVMVFLGFSVLARACLDLSSRRSMMIGIVVGMRRDLGVLGRTHHIALQAGDRAMARGLWADSFKVNRSTFKRLKPGDRVSVEYSPHLRYVYRAVEADRADHRTPLAG